jgi:hypothetical protein
MNEGIIEVFPEGNSNVKEAIEDLENILKPPPQLLGKRKSLPEESEEPGEPVVRAVTKPTKGYYGSKQEGKPKPYGMAPIWAEKRQQLCQVLKWFKAYQSGAYTNGGIAYGFLCDKEVGDRDYFGDQIMIARV